LASPGGFAISTPACGVVTAGQSTTVSAGHDINLTSQRNAYLLVSHGISMFSYGTAGAQQKPNQELGIRLHAAAGKVSCQSQDSDTRITADKAILVASVTKAVNIAAQKHLQFTAQGAVLKLEGGNIMLHGPGKIAFKAGQKELAGPKDSRVSLDLPKGELKNCLSKD
jgi:type VI secretion system secreted protein VgrG